MRPRLILTVYYIMFFITGLIFLFSPELFLDILIRFFSPNINIDVITSMTKMIGVFFLALPFGRFLLDYLQDKKEVTDRNSSFFNSYEEEFEKINDKLTSINTKIASENVNYVELDEKDKENLFSILSTQLEKNLSTEIISNLETKYSPSIIKSNAYADLENLYMDLRKRLLLEIERIYKRANLSLVLGTIVTLFGASLLFLYIFNNIGQYKDVIDFISFFVPRLTIIIFIEIFAFFFLKLYRTNLTDIKYYQNELTNIELKYLSLKSSFMFENNTTIESVIKELSLTDRNLILNRNESIFNFSDKKFIKQLKGLIEFLSKILSKKTV